MLNLFQHPIGQLIIMQNTLRVGSRNKFGMTRILGLVHQRSNRFALCYFHKIA
jgi:hypothetical protein